MSRVGILSPSLTTADAVSNDALGMYDVLTRQGHEVRLFCESHSLKHPGLSDIAPLGKFLKEPNDILLYHYSRGWDRGLQLLRELRCRRVIKYHNVTPAKYFTGFSSHDVELCEAGRRQLVDLVSAQCDLYLSASAFSMQELLELGAPASKAFVVPPFHHIDRLAGITADAEVMKKYFDNGANIVSVGRVVPHKGVLQLLEVFAHYYYGCNNKSRLLIVGKGGEGHSLYSKLLHRAVSKLGLSRAVVFTGGVSDEELKAYYLVAGAFVTTSEHEGFCVPLVEAMSMKLPIAAYASTAIPETLGDAGIVWADREPSLMAESIDLFLKDSSVRTTLGLRGLRRYEAMFSNEKIEATFLNAMSTLS
jgi:glycosyltransferase involved in cell wall biosynthesis